MTRRLSVTLSDAAFLELVDAAIAADTGSRVYAAQVIERWATRRRKRLGPYRVGLLNDAWIASLRDTEPA